jgi:hypothetical protein
MGLVVRETTVVDDMYGLGADDAMAGRVLHPDQLRAIFKALGRDEAEANRAVGAYNDGYGDFASRAYNDMVRRGYADY